MNRTGYLLRNINLINIILTGVLIFLVNYMLLPFLNKSIQFSLPVIAKHEESDSVNDKKPDQVKTPSPLDYMIISEQNLFHPERKIPVEVKEAQPLPKPDFVLYGTLLTEGLKIAYMEDAKSPHSTQGRGKRQTPLKQGEVMSGFTLKELSEDKAIMARGEERLTVYLIDPQKPKERVLTAPVASPVASSAPATKNVPQPPQPSALEQMSPTSQPSRSSFSKSSQSLQQSQSTASPTKAPIPTQRKPGRFGWGGSSTRE